jgi:hypothetical protein
MRALCAKRSDRSSSLRSMTRSLAARASHGFTLAGDVGGGNDSGVPLAAMMRESGYLLSSVNWRTRHDVARAPTSAAD